jgi:hypothetical protein
MIAMGVALLVLGGGFWAFSAWQELRETGRREEREAGREERRAEGLEQLAELRNESAALIPEMLEGVTLGMTLEEVRAIRGTRMSRDRRASEPGIAMWAERMPNGAQILYGFEERLGLLLQVQVMSLLPSVEAIAPHLTAMHETYGSPTGVWNCPHTEDVPTRRFTWRHAECAVSDIFLISPSGQVSVTLYVTTNERTAASLARSDCHVASPEELETFPIADHVPEPEEE